MIGREVQLAPPSIISSSGGSEFESDSNPLLEIQVAKGGGGFEADEDDGGLVHCCRICLESDSALGNELISPCMCKGTQQFVHRSCLDLWRSVKEGFAFSHCTTCKVQFHFRAALLEGNSWHKVKFRLFCCKRCLSCVPCSSNIHCSAGWLFLHDRQGWDL